MWVERLWWAFALAAAAGVGTGLTQGMKWLMGRVGYWTVKQFRAEIEEAISPQLTIIQRRMEQLSADVAATNFRIDEHMKSEEASAGDLARSQRRVAESVEHIERRLGQIEE